MIYILLICYIRLCKRKGAELWRYVVLHTVNRGLRVSITGRKRERRNRTITGSCMGHSLLGPPTGLPKNVVTTPSVSNRRGSLLATRK